MAYKRLIYLINLVFGHHGPTRSKGPASFEDKLAVWTRPEDAREKWSKAEDGPFGGSVELCQELERPSLEIDMLNTERTQKAEPVEIALISRISRITLIMRL